MILMVGGSTAQLTPARSADEWSKLFLREAASEVHSRCQNECQLLRPELNRLQPWRKTASRPFRPVSSRSKGAQASTLTQRQLNRWTPFERLSRAAKHDESRRMLEAKRAITNGCGASR